MKNMLSLSKVLDTSYVSALARKFHLSCYVRYSKKSGRPPSSYSEKNLQQLLNNAAIDVKQRAGDNKWLKSAYAAEDQRNQAAKALRPKTDPRLTSIILFPGQGVQTVGMAKHLIKIKEVKDMFHCANEILQYNLLDLCLHGPQDKLDQTMYCQPAIYVASLAALQLMIEERRTSIESCVATAGFSVGEFAALVLANSLSFESGLKLVKLRAEAMQEAARRVDGGMLTLFLDPGAKIGDIIGSATEWCRSNGIERPVCSVANYLFANCRVVAGNTEALKFIEENSVKLKIRRCRRIPVSGAFHTDIMKPAAEYFAEALKKTTVNDPEISVHSNVDGLAYRNAKDILAKLPKQIYRPVRWEQTMHILYDREKGTGYPQTFEVGPGKSLITLLRHANAPAAQDSVNILA